LVHGREEALAAVMDVTVGTLVHHFKKVARTSIFRLVLAATGVHWIRHNVPPWI
jgi:hypothetical protein